MNDRFVVVADGARARILAVEKREDAPARAAVRLVESARLANAAHTVNGRRAERKIKSGRDVGRGRIAPHGYTDKRDSHEKELLRRFAQRIALKANSLPALKSGSSVVLVADTRMLGYLRDAFGGLRTTGVTLRELPQDYAWCTAAQIKEHLARAGLLPGERARH